jgi:hypothetical protein
MDTLKITTTQNNIRSISLLGGIVIAIICALVSLKKVDSTTSSDASADNTSETLTFARMRLITNAASLAGHTVMAVVEEY